MLVRGMPIKTRLSDARNLRLGMGELYAAAEKIMRLSESRSFYSIKLADALGRLLQGLNAGSRSLSRS